MSINYGSGSTTLPNTKGAGQTTTFKETSDGQQYNVSMWCYDGRNNYYTETKTVRTYRTPKIQAVKPSSSTISGTPLLAPTINWSTNIRRWESNVEKDFQTQIKFVSGNNAFFDASDQQTGSDLNNAMYDGSDTLATS